VVDHSNRQKSQQHAGTGQHRWIVAALPSLENHPPAKNEKAKKSGQPYFNAQIKIDIVKISGWN
jgi:hypothetical protein